jgi:group I intron endonuclease
MTDRSELKKIYKRTVTPMGVYQIKNLVNGKIIIGSSHNLPARKNRFEMEFTLGSVIDEALQKDFKEFGEKNFSFEVLDYLEPMEDPAYDYKADLKFLEEMWLEKLQPFGDRGYNKMKKGGAVKHWNDKKE